MDASGRYQTIEELRLAFAGAEQDVIGDFGQEAWDSGYADVAQSLVDDCVPELRQWCYDRREIGWGLY